MIHETRATGLPEVNLGSTVSNDPVGIVEVTTNQSSDSIAEIVFAIPIETSNPLPVKDIAPCCCGRCLYLRGAELERAGRDPWPMWELAEDVARAGVACKMGNLLPPKF